MCVWIALLLPLQVFRIMFTDGLVWFIYVCEIEGRKERERKRLE